jgi:hypothetical protein
MISFGMHIDETFLQKLAAKLLALHILEVLYSNLGLEMGHPKVFRGFLLSFNENAVVLP